MRVKNIDIAKKLGISTTAVSLAVNNKPGVSEETRQRVLAELQNSYTADSPKKTYNGSLMLVIHKKSGEILVDKPFFSSMVESIQTEAFLRSYSLTISHYSPEQDLDSYIQMLSSMNTNGILLQATEMAYEDLEKYKSLPFPIVLIDSVFDRCLFDSVSLDDERCFFTTFLYVYEQGHRDIGFLKGSTPIHNFQSHFDGFQKGILRCHSERDNHPVITLPPSINGAYEGMKKFLQNPPQDFEMPTVFLSDLDYIALGAMKALKEAGYRIPDDVSLIGFEDVDACLISEPTLSTIQINRTDIGAIAINRLIEKINNKNSYCTETHVLSKLALRQSFRSLNGN